MVTIVVLLLLAVAYMIGKNDGWNEGYKAGDQDGKLDQHLYNERVQRFGMRPPSEGPGSKAKK